MAQWESSVVPMKLEAEWKAFCYAFKKRHVAQGKDWGFGLKTVWV